MKNKLDVKKINFVEIILWLNVIAFCAVFIMSTRYTVLWTDDFSHQRRMNLVEGSQLYKALQYTKTTYLTWQGTFFTIFLQSILSPAASESLRKLRLISMINCTMFLLSVIVIVKAFQKYYSYEAKKIVYVVISIIFPLFSYASYGEVLYWYSGQTAYTYPLSFGLFSIAFLLLSIKENKKVLYCISLLFVFFACGGSLTIAAMIFYISFLFVLYELYSLFKSYGKKFYSENKVLVIRLAVFLCAAFAACLINGLAPGNFARQSAGGSDGTGILNPIYYGFTFCISEFDKFFISGDTAFWIFALIMFSIGLLCKKEISMMEALIGLVSAAMFPIVALFPILLGYGYNSERTYFPNRAQFILDFSYIVSIQIIMFLFGIIMHSFIEKEARTRIIALLILILLPISLKGSMPISETMPVKVANALKDGSLRDSANRIANAYKEVEMSDQDDVAVLYPIEAVEWFDVFTLSDNPKDWSNQGIAGYFGKKSVGFYRELGE